MSAEFIEEKTTVEIMVAVEGQEDLHDPITRRTVVPAQVRLEMHRRIKPGFTNEWASVQVYGPRRLKSGELGKTISSFNWEQARNGGYRVAVYRPEWLTSLLAELLPEGWCSSSLELPEAAS